jgi:hypothetical protein
VAGGQGQPASAGRAFRLTKRPAPRASRKCRSRVVPEGRKCPAVARRTCFVAPRHAGGVSPIRRRGFSRRVALCAASGLNGQEGVDLSDGVRLPTRSKPSKGVALVGMWTSSELSSGGDGEFHGNPANPRSGTGMQQARNPRRGVNRRSGEIPQGRNENRGGISRSEPELARGSGRAWAHRRRGTRQSQGRKRIFLATRDPRPGVRRVEGEEGVGRSLFSVNEARGALSGSVQPASVTMAAGRMLRRPTSSNQQRGGHPLARPARTNTTDAISRSPRTNLRRESNSANRR